MKNHYNEYRVSRVVQLLYTGLCLKHEVRSFAIRLAAILLALAFSQTSGLAQSAPNNFSSVVNVDSLANSIGNGQSVGSDVQLNLFDGGSIGESFIAGTADVDFFGMVSNASTNVEVNIFGGTVGGDFAVLSGSTLNVFDGEFSDGSFASLDLAGGSNANFFGGNFEGRVNVSPESSTNISGGSFEDLFLLFSDASANISGGEFSSIFLSSGSTLNISGGTFGATQTSFGDINLFGTEFFLGGIPVDLEVDEALIVDERGVALSGRLADGSAFELNPIVGILNTNIAGTASFFEGSTLTINRVSSVPEPSAALLLCSISLLGLAKRRRPLD